MPSGPHTTWSKLGIRIWIWIGIEIEIGVVQVTTYFLKSEGSSLWFGYLVLCGKSTFLGC